jgi:protein-S-isoprenylcysteine O-methyltransferase Ste14
MLANFGPVPFERMNRRTCAILGSAVLGAFMVIEGRLRQTGEARTLRAGEQDKGTTATVGASFGLALVGGPVLAVSRRGRLPVPLGWIGVGIMVAGLALRVGAARTLGSHYTRTLQAEDDQPLVRSGPYLYVRHPGYAGVLAMWLGYGLALTSMPAMLITTVPNLLAYMRRIDTEETMLVESLGDAYSDYLLRTKRLIPGVY